MRQFAKSFLIATCAIALWAGAAEPADEETHPFKHIVERNVFALRPPPPPPDPSDVPPPPPALLAKVVLTGILNVLGPPRALLEVTENEPGKQAPPRKPILREGERDGSIEVLQIDVEKNVVRIKNGNTETNLTFEAQKQGPPSLAVAPPPSLPALGAPAIPSAPPMGNEEQSTRGRRGSVVLGGAQPAGAPNAAVPGAPPPLTLPSRQIRTSGVQPQGDGATDPVARWVQLKAQQEMQRRKNLPFPPVPGAADAGQVPPPPEDQ